MPNRIAPQSFGAVGSGRPTESGPARFENAGKLNLKVKEASDVVALPDGRFVVVGDMSDALHLANSEGVQGKLHLPDVKRGNSQFEGVAFDPVRNHLFVVREESSELLRYEWNPKKGAPPKLEKTFSLDDHGPRNKGFEGIAYLPEQLSPTGIAQLVLTKEGKPRSLVLRDDGGGGKDLPIDLESQVRSVCADFSAVAGDPKTGDLFVSSDESSTVAQVKLTRDGDKVRGKLVQSFPLRAHDKPLARVEGLTFDGRGNLFVLTENDGTLYKLARK